MKKKYTIEVSVKNDQTTCKRTNKGFNIYELLGVLEIAKQDILNQMKDNTSSEIDVIKKQVII